MCMYFHIIFIYIYIFYHMFTIGRLYTKAWKLVAEPLAILLGAGEVAWLVGFYAAG